MQTEKNNLSSIKFCHYSYKEYPSVRVFLVFAIISTEYLSQAEGTQVFENRFKFENGLCDSFQIDPSVIKKMNL